MIRALQLHLTTFSAAALLCGLGIGLFAPTDANAQLPSDVQQIYDEGKEALRDGRYFPALGKFQQALGLVEGHEQNTWQMMLAVALTYEQMDQLDHAIEYYNRFLAQAGDGSALDAKWRKRRSVAKNTVEQLESRVLQVRGQVTVVTEPSGGRVTINGAAVGADGTGITPFTMYLDPGRRTIKVTKEGFAAGELDVQVQVGTRQTVKVPLEPLENKGTLVVRTGYNDAEVLADGRRVGIGAEVAVTLAEGTYQISVRRARKTIFKRRMKVHPKMVRVVEVKKKGTATAATPGAKAPDGGAAKGGDKAASGGKPWWPWAVLGGGVAAAGAGGAFTAMAIGNKSDMEDLEATTPGGAAKYDSLESDLNTNQTIAWVLYGVGAAAITTGIVFLVMDDGGEATAAEGMPTFGWAPLPRGGSQLSATWAW